jgi:DNA-binding response OmpR family regulator
MDENGFILVVDDNEEAALLLANLLKTSGYNSKTVPNGKLIIEVLQQEKAELPSLILLDLAMPDINGLEILERIKADTNLPYIPIIVTTASVESENRIVGLQRGADDYLTKPINKPELLARVRSLLRLKSLYDEKTRLLSEVQSAYNQLNMTQAELMESEKKKAQMEGMITTAAAICHEMSQPLTSGLITLQFLHQANTEKDPDLEAIEQSLLQARAILDKLRVLTRYETKTYLGRERILDIDRSSEKNDNKYIVDPDELIG